MLFQVTISYDLPNDNYQDNIENTMFFRRQTSDLKIANDNISKKVINIKGAYSSDIDPTRFYSLHHRLTG